MIHGQGSRRIICVTKIAFHISKFEVINDWIHYFCNQNLFVTAITLAMSDFFPSNTGVTFIPKESF